MKKTLCKAQVLNKQKPFKIFAKSVSSFCCSFLLTLGQTGHSLSVVFVGSSEIREINRRYRGKDAPTDVLSFCYQKEMVEGMIFLGEIIISPEIACHNARARGTAFEAEIRMLLLHGILHLLGYDHETDNGEMDRMQKNLMRRRIYLDSAPVAEASRR